MLSITDFSRLLCTCVYTGSIVFYVVDMNVKQIKNTLLAFLFIISSFASVIVVSDTAQAYKCPTGQEFHSEDNACWTKSTKTITKGNNQSDTFAQKCQGGTVTNANGNSATCETFTRSNSAPTNDDGQPASFTCPSGQEYHASDNKCWTKSTRFMGNRDTCSGTVGTDANGNKTCSTFTEGGAPAISPSANANLAYCAKKYVSSGNENMTKEKAACEAGQTGKDCSTLTGSEKAACEDGEKNPPPGGGGGGGGGGGPTQGSGECGGARTNLISCDGTGVDALANVLKQVLQVLTVLIGIVAVGGIAYGAIMYASAQDNSGQTQKAIEVIRNVLIGVLLYGFMVVIINWLSPIAIFG